MPLVHQCAPRPCWTSNDYLANTWLQRSTQKSKISALNPFGLEDLDGLGAGSKGSPTSATIADRSWQVSAVVIVLGSSRKALAFGREALWLLARAKVGPSSSKKRSLSLLLPKRALVDGQPACPCSAQPQNVFKGSQPKKCARSAQPQSIPAVAKESLQHNLCTGSFPKA